MAVGPFMNQEQPPANSLLSCMHGIARDCLLNLRQQRLRIADEKIAYVLASLEFRSQNVARDAKQTTFQLHETSIEGGAAVHACGSGAYAPRGRDLILLWSLESRCR